MTTSRQIPLTGNLITECLIDGLHAYAEPLDENTRIRFVSLALNAYQQVIEAITPNALWHRSYSQLIVPYTTELPDDWTDQLETTIRELDLTPLIEQAERETQADQS